MGDAIFGTIPALEAGMTHLYLSYPSGPIPCPQRLSNAHAVVDIKLLRQVLKMNPSMRRGKTTQELKKEIERGGSPTVLNRPAPGHCDAASREPLGAALYRLLDEIDKELQGQRRDHEARQSIMNQQRTNLRNQSRQSIQAFLQEFTKAEILNLPPSILESWKKLLQELGENPKSVLQSALNPHQPRNKAKE